MIITFGALAAFFLFIVAVLTMSWIRDRTFSDYAVGGRSFDARFQAMSFLNTYFPGAVITAFGGMAASVGALSFYFVTYTMLTVVLMYLMAKPVWYGARPSTCARSRTFSPCASARAICAPSAPCSASCRGCRG